MTEAKKFSSQIEQLFRKNKILKLSQLNTLFGEKSFALAFILLIITAALPLPTGGITHFFEIVTILLALELVAGKERIWIPKRWENRSINSPKPGKGLGRIVGFVKFFERFSKKRGSYISSHHLFVRFIGLLVAIYTLSAFLAPPFSGLDTVPSLGVVTISLGLILDDLLITVFGIIIGAVGIAIVLSLTDFMIRLAQQLLK